MTNTIHNEAAQAHSLHIGQYHYVYLGNLKFHIETLQSLLFVNLIICIFLAVLQRRVRQHVTRLAPRGLQNVVEMLVAYVRETITFEAGERGKKYAPLVGTIFVFILTCNYFGLVPWSQAYQIFFSGWLGERHHFIPPTMDINTTVALAIAAMVSVHVIGVRERGLRYFSHLFVFKVIPNPMAFMEELARPFSLTVRLFANLFAHETIIAVLLFLVAWPLVFPIPIVMLGLITGAIQAYVFALLTANYIGGALKEHH